MPIHRELNDLPLILCGPILRQVACDPVSVLVALKERRFVELAIYEGTDAADLPLHISPPAETVALGQHLHVLVITASIESGAELKPGQIYGYDLRFCADDSGANCTWLRQEAAETAGSEGLLAGEFALGYSPGALPSFVLPPIALSNLRLVHGSCRKPHGEGRDALAVLDDLLRATYDKLDDRPQMLLLTGDQIYADDVAATLLLSLFETAKRLLGWEEIVPAPYSLELESIAALGDLDFVPDALSSIGEWGHTVDHPDPVSAKSFFTRLAPPLRSKEIRANARFDSNAMDAHLMFAGEFYLMYLFAWSNVLWPRDDKGEPSLPEYDQAVPAFSPVGRLSKPALEEERARALEFAGTLRKVRRALANIPTWMIFDDHEVTDDWNLNHDWVKRVNASPMGPHLIRNALAAYAIFQDWGNQPEDYAAGRPGAEILDALTWSGANAAPDAFQSGQALLELFKLRDPAATPKPSKRWHYAIAPSYPGQPAEQPAEYAITVLDTRTCRGFPDQTLIDEAASALKHLLGDDSNPSAGLVLNAALLSDTAFTEQLVGQLHPARVNLVVSPAPVFGVPIVEDVIQRLMVLKDNPEAHDNEAWNGHHGAFRRLFEFLSRFENGVVLLSGDVHYAFSNEIAFPAPGGASNLPQRVVQLCASSLRNEAMMTHTIGTIGHPRLEALDPHNIEVSLEAHRLKVTWEELPLGGFTALVNEMAQRFHDEITAPVEFDEWGKTAFLSDPFDPLNVAMKLRDGNALSVPGAFALPNELVFGAALGSGLYDFARDFGVGLPGNWRFTVKHLRDARDGHERGANGQPAGTSDLPEYTAAFVGDQCRDIVGHNNLAKVTFKTGGGKTSVAHYLYWYAHDRRGRTLLRTFETQHEAELRVGP